MTSNDNDSVSNYENIVCHDNTSRKRKLWLPGEDAVILHDREIDMNDYSDRAAK